MDHVLGIHHIGMLKPFVRDEIRVQIAKRGLDAYTTNVVFFNLTLQAACFGKIAARYRYLYDWTDRYRKDIAQILAALKNETNQGLRLWAVEGEPQPEDSKDHRFIQLSDTAAYFLVRQRQIEIRTFKPGDALLKHRDEILEIYALLKPKILDFVSTGMISIDWKALEQWAHPKKGRNIRHGTNS